MTDALVNLLATTWITGDSIPGRIRDISSPALGVLHPLPDMNRMFHQELESAPRWNNGDRSGRSGYVKNCLTPALESRVQFPPRLWLYICGLSAFVFPYNGLKPCLKNNTRCLNMIYSFRSPFSIGTWQTTLFVNSEQDNGQEGEK